MAKIGPGFVYVREVADPRSPSGFDTLWGVKSAGASKEERESYRIVQAGYAFLMKWTRLSKKTIQRIVEVRSLSTTVDMSTVVGLGLFDSRRFNLLQEMGTDTARWGRTPEVWF